MNHSFASITLKTTVVHTVTYFLVGLLAFSLLDYTSRYADPIVANLMRQTDDPRVAAGPLFQVLRGFLFGIAFYLMREIIFSRKNGWLILWAILVIVGILSPFGPTPGSIEGLIYTNLPVWFHLVGLPEVLIQAFLLSFLTYYWVNHPEKKWLTWVFGISFVMIILLAGMAALVGFGIINSPA